jgi:nitronate monooxygenase
MKTRITELLGIEHPIIQGGMHYRRLRRDGRGRFQRGRARHHHRPDAEDARPISPTRSRVASEMTDKPFGVNLTFLPVGQSARLSGLHRARSSRAACKIVETAGNNPAPFLPDFKEAGIKVIHKCTSVRHALKAAERSAATRSSVDGFECGGHPGEDDIPNFILLPRAAEELDDPLRRLGRHGRRPQPRGRAGAGRGRHQHGHALHRDQGSAGA